MFGRHELRNRMGQQDKPSREAAQEYSPRRKPWVKVEHQQAPEGAKEYYAHKLCSAAPHKTDRAVI